MTYDCIIVGGGHNALVAATYLGKAGKKVLILEKNDYIGGATFSKKIFPAYEAYLSQYSYLVSLFPQQLFKELGLNVPLLQRKTASFTPYLHRGQHRGLLMSNVDERISEQSVLGLGYGEKEWRGYQNLCNQALTLAELTWDSFLQPLENRTTWEKRFREAGYQHLWKNFVENPIGEVIEQQLASDVLRGVVMTDAKIGSFTHAHDASLLQNRTYLYHVVGNKTGEWRVPQGGMGNIAKQLLDNALALGVAIQTNAEVKELQIASGIHTLHYTHAGKEYSQQAKQVFFSSLSPKFRWLTQQPITDQDEGTAFKINLLLKKLPTLKAPIKAEDAFAGTFHINQGYEQMEESFQESLAGKVPSTLPCEMYCHTLTDSSILSPELQKKGFQTITVFGIDMAHRLFLNDNEATKKRVIEKFFEGINAYLEEPLQNCLASNPNGSLCIEAKSAIDLEQNLGMVRGSIFHGQLSWFFAEKPSEIGTWGVETLYKNVYLCGSAALRGGAVSGIAGRNAAMKALGKI